MSMIQHTKGFTVIELLVAIAITAIVTTLAANFAIRGLQVQRIVGEQNQAVAEARQALDRFVNEMRETSPSDTGAYPIELATDQELIFFSDVDHDEMIERIHYYLEGSLLQRGVTEPTGDPLSYPAQNEQVQTVSQYIRNGTEPLFYYYNESYPADQESNPIEPPVPVADIRLIELHILTNVDPNRVPKTHQLDVEVHLRNLKENF